VPLYDGGNTLNAYYICGLGLLYKVDDGGNAYYYHYTFTGNTAAMTDQAENIVNSYAYTPFGELAGKDETVSNPFRYVGKFGVMDDGSGLLYMRARYYDPDLGRFITKDPIGFAGGVNLYAYVGGNPVGLIDPLGLCRGNKSFSELVKPIDLSQVRPRFYYIDATKPLWQKVNEYTEYPPRWATGIYLFSENPLSPISLPLVPHEALQVYHVTVFRNRITGEYYYKYQVKGVDQNALPSVLDYEFNPELHW
jgi:RHS repeat-associated protein